MDGAFILIVGPSGSGKGVLMEFLRQRYPDAFFPISWTTRIPRPGEKEGISGSGKRYAFVTEEEFKHAIEQNIFLEWDKHFSYLYGTPRAEVQKALEAGKLVIQELDVEGARQIIKNFQHPKLFSIYIDAGNWEELKERIIERAEIQEDELLTREIRFQTEEKFKSEANFTVRNEHGKLEEAKQALSKIIDSVLV